MNVSLVQLSILGVLISAAPVRAATELERHIDDLEASAAILGARSSQCAHLARDARSTLAADPYTAANLFALAMRQCPALTQDAALVLDSARAEAMIGTSRRALKRFAAASRLANRTHELAVAVEATVALAERVGDLPELPPVERYVTQVGYRGRLDPVGYETLYRLGRTLARRGDGERALAVLSAIPDDTTAARRALYVRGVVHLAADDTDTARWLFQRAANLPPRNLSGAAAAREGRVTELAWLAVGRLAFESGDAATGFFAYQQVLVHSPAFPTAFMEMGWLAMEHNDEEVALLAFEPLLDLEATGEVGRRAGLLKGYVLLHQRDYDRARDHYKAVARQYRDALTRFDVELKQFPDLARLAHDCEARDRALSSPALAPMMRRPQIARARRLDHDLGLLAAEREGAALQLRAADDLLAGQRHPNPLTRLAEWHRAAAAVLHDVNTLSIELERTAGRRSWRAETVPTAAAPHCCREPRQRLGSLRSALESLLMVLQELRRATRHDLEELRDELHRQAAEDERRYQSQVPKIHAEQRRLAAAAAHAVRESLRTTAIEGEAGVLEAVWRFKEDHRDQIQSAEVERKAKLDELLWRFSDALEELSDD
jgi:tetratricopeptide (TPR) repeat protein